MTSRCAATTARLFYEVPETTVGGRITAPTIRRAGAKPVPFDHGFEYRLENDPRFLRRIEQARGSLQAGRGVRLEDLETE
jgi:hypothetical protein